MTMNEASEQARDLVQRLTPSLRRFAWALTAGSERARGDELVRIALEGPRPAAKSDGAAKADLYRRVLTVNRRRQPRASGSDEAGRRASGTVVADIERLPLDQREALLLVVLGGFSHEETAAILGLPRSSVVARLLRARNMLAGGERVTGGTPHLRLVK